MVEASNLKTMLPRIDRFFARLKAELLVIARTVYSIVDALGIRPPQVPARFRACRRHPPSQPTPIIATTAQLHHCLGGCAGTGCTRFESFPWENAVYNVMPHPGNSGACKNCDSAEMRPEMPDDTEIEATADR